jgi:hypothetical protein
VRREHAHPKTTSLNGAPETNNLPGPLTRIVGRGDVIATLTKQLAQRRLLTIVGPGESAKPRWRSPSRTPCGRHTETAPGFSGWLRWPIPIWCQAALGTVLGITLFGINPLSGLTA